MIIGFQLHLLLLLFVFFFRVFVVANLCLDGLELENFVKFSVFGTSILS